MNDTRRFPVLVGVILYGLMVSCFAVSCGSDDDPPPAPDPTATPAVATPTAVAPTPTPQDPPPPSSDVLVYWAWTIPTHPITPERLGVGGRSGDSAAPARAALEALFAGPTERETEIAMVSSIPDGTQLLDLNIANGDATVDLSSDFETTVGTLNDTFAAAQVVFTLTQFPTVDTVFFRIDGIDRDTIGSHGLDVSGGVDRSDFEPVRPLISVENPYAFATVTDPFVIRGEANTFEANVQWVLTDNDGLIIGEGFTTATEGNGTWGTYSIDVDVPDGVTGRGAVIVFETSARDGEQISVVEYPIFFS